MQKSTDIPPKKPSLLKHPKAFENAPLFTSKVKVPPVKKVPFLKKPFVTSNTHSTVLNKNENKKDEKKDITINNNDSKGNVKGKSTLTQKQNIIKKPVITLSKDSKSLSTFSDNTKLDNVKEKVLKSPNVTKNKDNKINIVKTEMIKSDGKIKPSSKKSGSKNFGSKKSGNNNLDSKKSGRKKSGSKNFGSKKSGSNNFGSKKIGSKKFGSKKSGSHRSNINVGEKTSNVMGDGEKNKNFNLKISTSNTSNSTKRVYTKIDPSNSNFDSINRDSNIYNKKMSSQYNKSAASKSVLDAAEKKSSTDVISSNASKSILTENMETNESNSYGVKNGENTLNMIKQKKQQLVERSNDIKENQKEDQEKILSKKEPFRRIQTKEILNYESPFNITAPPLFCESAYKISKLPPIEHKINAIRLILENHRDSIISKLEACMENEKECSNILENMAKALIEGEQSVISELNKNKILKEEIVNQIEIVLHKTTKFFGNQQ